jgi:hypothetical protein
MTFATLDAAKRHCESLGQVADWAAIYQTQDRDYFYQWAETRQELIAFQIVRAGRIVAFWRNGAWNGTDHLLMHLHRLCDSAERFAYLSSINQALADGIRFLTTHNLIDMAREDSGGVYFLVPEEAPYEWSAELDVCLKLLQSAAVADRLSALMFLTTWDLELLPADIHRAIELTALTDPIRLVRQWAEFVLDPLTKPIPPREVDT